MGAASLNTPGPPYARHLAGAAKCPEGVAQAAVNNVLHLVSVGILWLFFAQITALMAVYGPCLASAPPAHLCDPARPGCRCPPAREPFNSGGWHTR